MAGHQRTADTPAGGGRADTPAGGGQAGAILRVGMHACAMGEFCYSLKGLLSSGRCAPAPNGPFNSPRI